MSKKYKPTVYETPFQHVKYFLVRNDHQLSRMKRRFGINEDLIHFLDGDTNPPGRCSFLENGGKVLCIVQIVEDESVSQLQYSGLIAHEAVHIWQEAKELMGEETPSTEFEAYSIQAIFQDLLHSFFESEKYGEKKHAV